MGISEIEALAIIFGGVVLIHRFYTRDIADILAVAFLVLGCIMLAFGLADIIADNV